MLYRLRAPVPPLRPFVEYLWYHEGVTTDYAMERLLPDGAMELIVDLTDSAKHWARGDLSPRVGVHRSWLSGQHSGPIAVEAAKHSRMIGARFRPGGAAPFIPVPASALNDSVVELDLLWRGGAEELREQLLAEPTIDGRFARLEQALLCRGRGRLQMDRALAGALHALTTTPESTTIRALSARLGVSQKRLTAVFDERVGLKPKMLSRVLRLQRVLRHIEQGPALPWSALAAEYGYCDQAHLVKDFVALTHLRPREYLNARGEWLNWIPLD